MLSNPIRSPESTLNRVIICCNRVLGTVHEPPSSFGMILPWELLAQKGFPYFWKPPHWYSDPKYSVQSLL